VQIIPKRFSPRLLPSSCLIEKLQDVSSYTNNLVHFGILVVVVVVVVALALWFT